jgi:hypothetical protein
LFDASLGLHSQRGASVSIRQSARRLHGSYTTWWYTCSVVFVFSRGIRSLAAVSQRVLKLCEKTLAWILIADTDFVSLVLRPQQCPLSSFTADSVALQIWFDALRDGRLPIEILKGDKAMVRGGELFWCGLTMFQYVHWHEDCGQNGGSSVPFHRAPELLHSYPASLIYLLSLEF